MTSFTEKFLSCPYYILEMLSLYNTPSNKLQACLQKLKGKWKSDERRVGTMHCDKY